MIKGDIVTPRGRNGLFVYDGLAATAVPPNEMGRFLRASQFDRDNPREALTMGLAMVVDVIASPSFTPGEHVHSFDKSQAEVVRDIPEQGMVEITMVP